MKPSLIKLGFLISTTLFSIVSVKPAFGLALTPPTGGLAITSYIVGGVSTIAGGTGAVTPAVGTRLFQGIGGLGLALLDPAPATFLNGKIVLSYPDSLLEVESIGWFGNFAVDPSLPVPPVSSTGFIETGGTYQLQQQPNPLLNISTSNSSGVLTVEFDASPAGLLVDSPEHFNFMGILFRNISPKNLAWRIDESSPNFFQNPSQQILTCIPSGETVPVTCGGDTPPIDFTVEPVPEPSTILGSLAFSAGAALKRKRKLSKSTEKKTEKVF